MAFPIARQTTELLDTLVNTTINTLTADPAWLVDNKGEKLLRKMAQRGRVFSEVSDADAIEHPLMVNTVAANSWQHYRGSRATSTSDPTMGAATSLSTDQEDIFSVARSTILDTASNFVVPQDILKRPVQKQLDTVEALMKRHMAGFFREMESYLVLGNATADTAAPAVLAPHITDSKFGTSADYDSPSFSLLGNALVGYSTTDSQYGDLSDKTFMGINDANWDAYVDLADGAAAKTNISAGSAANGQDVYEYLQKWIIQIARYGPGEMVTDWLVTPHMYEAVLT